MIATSVRFRGHRCFKREFAGFDTIKPVNVIIGRNNTGKSHLLDLVAALCKKGKGGSNWQWAFRGILDRETLQAVFSENESGGDLLGNHWANHGQYFVGAEVAWEINKHGEPVEINFPASFNPKFPFGNESADARGARLRRALKESDHALTSKVFRRLLADRDVRPEQPHITLNLGSAGDGATNIIRRHIVTSNEQFPRELIQTEVLNALNDIFGSDGQFKEIQVKLHDEREAGALVDHWEVYLGEEKKGLVPLTNSGSGLKTVLLVLLNLLVVPAIEKNSPENFVFAFEELENNLHPALLRRLLQFIEAYAVRERCPIFLTTHSSTALDLFGVSKNSQIVHVTHDREAARVCTVSAHFDHLGVISELGAKPSDLLQANGIIWVEGPSDCIYINRWLDLYSGGKFQEGRDYQCAFYGALFWHALSLSHLKRQKRSW